MAQVYHNGNLIHQTLTLLDTLLNPLLLYLDKMFSSFPLLRKLTLLMLTQLPNPKNEWRWQQFLRFLSPMPMVGQLQAAFNANQVKLYKTVSMVLPASIAILGLNLELILQAAQFVQEIRTARATVILATHAVRVQLPLLITQTALGPARPQSEVATTI